MNESIAVDIAIESCSWYCVASNNQLSLWVRGYAFLDDKYYTGETLLRDIFHRLEQHPLDQHSSCLDDLIPKLNGCWAMIYKSPSVILAAVDRIRSIPLFYGFKNSTVVISDNGMTVLEGLNGATLSDIGAAEFLVAGYVTGCETLFEGIYQLEAGTILRIPLSPGSPNAATSTTIHRYYRFIVGEYFEATESELVQELATVLERVFRRHAAALQNSTPLVPLSGGADSRLVVSMLKSHGIENAICYSFGRKGNPESEFSRAVAQSLGYKWVFIPYDHVSWYRWYREKSMQEYLFTAGGCASIASTQEYPAVCAIARTIRDEEVVFVPGHSGDFIAGSHIPQDLFYMNPSSQSPNFVAKSVLSNHYVLWPWQNDSPELRDLFTVRLLNELCLSTDSDNTSATGQYETWDFENRQCRFIVNAVRMYEFTGDHPWALPFWDYELMDFYCRIRPELRFRKRLYLRALLERVWTDSLGILSRIPIVGSPLPGRTRYISPMMRLHRGLYRHPIQRAVRKHCPSLHVYLTKASRVLDHTARYGRYCPKITLATLSKSLGEVFPVQLDAFPPLSQNILRPNLNRSIMLCETNGVNAMLTLDFFVRENVPVP